MDALRRLNPKTVAEAREAGWGDLAVRCTACGREAHVSWDRFPPGTPITALANHLKCQGCGARQPTCWPWMDAYELKRLQRMVRS